MPQLNGRVDDYAGVLSAPTKKQLEAVLADLEKTDATQSMVLTLSSVEGENLEQFSIRVAETWKIGQKGLDNGAILLVALKERKIRIEVGYGLEGRLTDLVTDRIIRNVIVPHFKTGNFDQGIADGVAAWIFPGGSRRLAGVRPLYQSARPQRRRRFFIGRFRRIFRRRGRIR